MIKVTNEGKITISAENLEQAKRSVVLIEDTNLRKKFYAYNVALLTFVDEMKKVGISINEQDSLTRVHSFAEFADLSNLNYRGLRIDVRVILDGEDLFIPKSHKREEITPDLYVCAKLNKNFNYVEFLGFIETDRMPEVTDMKEYYSLPVSELNPMEILPDVLESKRPSLKDFGYSDHAKVQELFVNYFDGKLSRVEKFFLIKHLFYCDECRKKFLNFYEFDNVSRFVQKEPMIAKKYKQLDVSQAVMNTFAKENLSEKSEKNAKETANRPIEMTLKNDIYTINDIEDSTESASSKLDDDDFFARVRDDIKKSEKQQLFKNKFKRAMESEDGLVTELKANKNKDVKNISEGVSKDIAEDDEVEIDYQKTIAKDMLKKSESKVQENKEPAVKKVSGQIKKPIKKVLEKPANQPSSLNKKSALKQVSGHMNIKTVNSSGANIVSKNEKSKIKHPIEQIDLDKNPTDGNKVVFESKDAKSSRKSLVDKYLKDEKTTGMDKTFKKVAAASLIVGLLCGGALYGYKHYKSKAAQDSIVAVSGNVATVEMNKEGDAPKTQVGGIQQAIAEGFGDYAASISVSNLAWEVAPEYTSNQNFINFLQNSGVSLQSGIQDALMNVGEEYSAIGDHVKLAFTLSRDVGIRELRVEETSGSNEIDDTVKEAVLSTLKYFSFPDVGKGIDNIDFRLLVEF